jgi:putative protease
MARDIPAPLPSNPATAPRISALGSQGTRTIPELLAPVGDMEMALAAIHGGADAIYLGVPGFNARGRTQDFSLEELAELRRLCALFGVKFYLALNILIFEAELVELTARLPEWLALRPDAFIVQDLGLARLIRAHAPAQELHASTQATVTCAEAIEALAPLGFQRYVLARELSLDQLREIRTATAAELEVFIHGALCVAYSGQCLTSETFGGRSANRGQCAQACRFEYELRVDGQPVPLQGKRYLVSPKDLCALDEVTELARLGIDSLKIEGRLKRPEYVAATLASYRAALEGGEAPGDRSRLARIFSRGFHSGWLRGVAHQELADGFHCSHVGELLGTVVRVEGRRITIRHARPGTGGAASDTEEVGDVVAGDGILFLEPRTGTELGARLHAVERHGRQRLLVFGAESDLHGVREGWECFCNGSPSQDKELRRSWTDRESRRRIPVAIRAEGMAGEPLQLRATDPEGNQASACSETSLEMATRQGLESGSLTEELKTPEPWLLSKLDNHLPPGLFLHRQEIRKTRQRLLEQLEPLRIERMMPHIEIRSPREAAAAFAPASQSGTHSSKCDAEAPLQPTEPICPPPQLHVLVRQLDQIPALAGLPLASLTMDFEYGVPWRRALEAIRETGLPAGLATPRILKPGEQRQTLLMAELAPDRILVRNLGALQLLGGRGLSLIGDAGLNVANSLSAEWLAQQGLERLSPGFDLDRAQLESLIAATDPALGWELCLHHYMPAFHMEHCVFASCLSSGNSVADCGKPCRNHQVELQDPKGEIHVLQSDPFCRNTLYRGAPQAAFRLVEPMRARGVNHFRLEALRETPAELRSKVELTLELMAGRLSTETALARLALQEQFGVTEGQLFTGRTWQDRKKR